MEMEGNIIFYTYGSTLELNGQQFDAGRLTEDLSMSDYVTACCLGKQVVVIDGLKDVLKELKSIGRNLNQLVTLAHMGRVTVIDLESVRQALSELSEAIRSILERKRW